MKTLEQVIKDVCARHLAAYKVNRYDAEAIANDVREWLREQNKRLKVVIEEALIDVDPGFNDLELDEMSNAVLSVLPFYETKSETEHFKGNHEVVATKLVEFFSMHGEKLQSTTFEQLASYITLPMYMLQQKNAEQTFWRKNKMNQHEQDQFEQILKILEDERIGDVNRSKAQATAIIEWLEKKKARMGETIRTAYNHFWNARQWKGAPDFMSATDLVAAICAALVPPLQIPPFTDDDADRAFREDEHDREISRLTKELEEANSYIESAKRENAHYFRELESKETELTNLRTQLKEKTRILSPGDKRWVFINNKIRQVVVEEINTDRVTVSVNCQGKSGMCYEGLKPEQLFFTEADCRASVEAVGLE